MRAFLLPLGLVATFGATFVVAGWFLPPKGAKSAPPPEGAIVVADPHNPGNKITLTPMEAREPTGEFYPLEDAQPGHEKRSVLRKAVWETGARLRAKPCDLQLKKAFLAAQGRYFRTKRNEMNTHPDRWNTREDDHAVQMFASMLDDRVFSAAEGLTATTGMPMAMMGEASETSEYAEEPLLCDARPGAILPALHPRDTKPRSKDVPTFQPVKETSRRPQRRGDTREMD